jgi:hypothetical protein
MMWEMEEKAGKREIQTRAMHFIPLYGFDGAESEAMSERLFAIQPSCGLKSALRSLAQRSG